MFIHAQSLYARILMPATIVLGLLVSCSKKDKSGSINKAELDGNVSAIEQLVTATDEKGNPTEVTGFSENKDIKQDDTFDVRTVPADDTASQNVFEFKEPEGYTPEFSEPILITGGYLNLAPNFDDCLQKTYQPEEPTLADILRYSGQNDICGQVALNFCIRLTPKSASGKTAYLKTPPLKMQLLCREESFAGIGLTVEGGAATTSADQVDLQITAGFSITQMYITNTPACKDGGSWEPALREKKSWPLAQTNGEATVYIAFKNFMDQESACISASIVHQEIETDGLPSADLDPPTGTSLSINSGDALTNATSATLSLAAIDASHMYITDTSGCASGGSWLAFATSSPWTLAQTDGMATVYVKFKDAAGNESACINDTITHDAQAPTATSITINSGESHTNATSATLSLAASDASHMYITDTSGCASGGSWLAFASSSPWSLAQTESTATVYVKFKDAAGNESTCINDTITHDSQAPTATTITISSNDTYTTSSTVTLGLSASAASMMYITNTASCTSDGTWESYATTKTGWLLDPLNTTTTVYARFRDEAGNVSACINDSIIHDGVNPTTPTSFSDGTTISVSNQSPLLSWGASTDSGSGLAAYEIALGTTLGGTEVQGWTNIGTATSTTLTGLALQPTVTYYASVRALDTAGNVSSVATSDGFIHSAIWQQQAFIKASNADSGDKFGGALSLYDDTLAVGVSWENSNQTTITNGTTASTDDSWGYAGAVYMYKRTATAWAQEAFIKPYNARDNNYFGSSVALYGDTLLVGQPDDPSSVTTITYGSTSPTGGSNWSNGSIVVFKRTGTTWAQERSYQSPGKWHLELWEFHRLRRHQFAGWRPHGI